MGMFHLDFGHPWGGIHLPPFAPTSSGLEYLLDFHPAFDRSPFPVAPSA
jgi:hypothetical protein